MSPKNPIRPLAPHAVITAALMMVMASPIFVPTAWSQVAGWRADGSGVFPGQSPPTAWDAAKNIVWATSLRAESNGSPVIMGERLFIMQEPTDLLALDVSSGRLLWQRSSSIMDILEGAERAKAEEGVKKAEVLRDDLDRRKSELYKMKRRLRGRTPDPGLPEAVKSLEAQVNQMRKDLDKTRRIRALPVIKWIGYSSSTPVVDEEGIYALFGNGVLSHFDFAGARRWSRVLGDPPVKMRGYQEGHAASPMIIGDRLVVGLDKLRALNKKTGEVLWEGRIFRDFGTPAHLRVDGVDMVVTGFGEVYRLSDGAVLAGDLGHVLHLGPVVAGDTLYFVGSDFGRAMSVGADRKTLDRPATARAIQVSMKGGDFTYARLWETNLEAEDYYATPVVHKRVLYAVSAKGVLTAVHADTGALIYRKDLGTTETIYASPSVAGGYLYILSQGGKSWVFRAGPEGELVSENRLRDNVWSSPYFHENRIYVRGYRKLFCLGSKL